MVQDENDPGLIKNLEMNDLRFNQLEHQFLPLHINSERNDNMFESDDFNSNFLGIYEKSDKQTTFYECQNTNLNVYEKWVNGIGMYDTLEFVCFRFENQENNESIDWVGCHHPKRKTFEECANECFKHILDRGCTKLEAEEWIKNLPSLEKWMDISDKIIREAYLHGTFTRSIDKLMQTASSGVLNLQTTYKMM